MMTHDRAEMWLLLTCTDLDAIILSESLSFTVGVPLTYLLRSAFWSGTRVFSSSYIQNSSFSCSQHSCVKPALDCKAQYMCI